MRRNYKLILGIIGLCFIVTGCGKEKEEEVSAAGSRWSVNMCYAEEGLLYANSDPNGKLEYYDYGTGEFLPLCGKANCLHDTEECTAIYLRQKAAFIGQMGEKWYFWSPGENGPQGGSFYSCNLDGSGVREVGKFPYEFSSIGNQALFYDQACILAAGNVLYDAETGMGVKVSSSIYRYHLETGEVEVLCQEKEALRPSYVVYGIYENKLIYSELDGEKCILKKLDLDTGETDSLLDDMNLYYAYLSGEKIACSGNMETKDQIIELDLETGERKEVFDSSAASTLFWSPKLKGFSVDTGQMYQYTEDGEATEIRKGWDFEPRAAVGETVLGTGSKSSSLLYMDKKDFLAGKDNWKELHY